MLLLAVRDMLRRKQELLNRLEEMNFQFVSNELRVHNLFLVEITGSIHECSCQLNSNSKFVCAF